SPGSEDGSVARRPSLRSMEEELVGTVGDVVVRIEGGDDPGEVSLIVDGIRERYFAHAREEVPLGRRVLVVHHRGDRTVDVEPWTV
ncbi:MAG: hypothetical protein JWO12_1309, partial [Frankiales bacterium]|nr:hypothetical protein [Frankiales bacterium]